MSELTRAVTEAEGAAIRALYLTHNPADTSMGADMAYAVNTVLAQREQEQPMNLQQPAQDDNWSLAQPSPLRYVPSYTSDSAGEPSQPSANVCGGREPIAVPSAGEPAYTGEITEQKIEEVIGGLLIPSQAFSKAMARRILQLETQLNERKQA